MTKISPQLQQAIDAYREYEKKRFAADRAKRDLTVAAAALAVRSDPSELATYLMATEDIEKQYEEKREKELLL